jgi:hypothetical protein
MGIPRFFLNQQDAGWPIGIYEQQADLVWSELRRTPGGRAKREIGWGGRIRTFTVLINSEVSYQLDHAPAGQRARGKRRAKGCQLRGKTSAKYLSKIARGAERPNEEGGEIFR